jgi:hypothetical protein
MASHGQSQPQVRHLRLDRVVRRPEEVFNARVLLDPFEEQLHPPAAFVELGNRQCGQFEVISQEGQRLAGVRISITNPPEPLG